MLKHAVPSDGLNATKSKVPITLALASAQAVYVLTDSNVPSAPNFPLPRDVSRSAAYANTKSLILTSLENLASNEESNAGERPKMLQVLLIGIYQNLSHQQAYGKQVRSDEDEDFGRLALRILVDSLKNVHLAQEASAASEAYRKLPKRHAVSSVEAAELSEPKKKLDACEARWTRLRLAIEILGELVGELDGIVDSGLLGDEVYEEWHGIENGGGEAMEADDAESASTSQEQQSRQKPESLSRAILSIIAQLPSLLVHLAQPTSISFSSPAEQPMAESGLIATQSETSASNGVGKPSFVPVISDLASLIHGRALECLNNLFITISRSRSAGGGLTHAPADDAVDDSMMHLAEGDDGTGARDDGDDVDMESGTSADGEQTTNGDVAASPIQDASTTYVASNIETLQQCWQALFALLVTYLAMYEQRGCQSSTSSLNSGKDKKSSAAGPTSEEPLGTLLEAVTGSIWALARLCINQLVGIRAPAEMFVS